MAEKHTSKAHFMSLKRRAKCHTEARGFYFNRTFSGDCDYRIVDGDIDAGVTACEGTGREGRLPIKS